MAKAPCDLVAASLPPPLSTAAGLACETVASYTAGKVLGVIAAYLDHFHPPLQPEPHPGACASSVWNLKRALVTHRKVPGRGAPQPVWMNRHDKGYSMTIDISGGRFGSVSLGMQDVQNIRQAADRDHIGSVFSRAWDKIADWFSSTDRTEAKKCLFDLCSESTTHGQKIESFMALKDMAGAHYQSRFQVEENEEGVRYTLDLAEEQCPGFSLGLQKLPVDRERLGEELNRSDYWGHNGVGSARDQVKADICRASYSVSGTSLQAGTPEERMGHFDEALKAIGATPSQREAIMEVCNQAVLGTFMQASNTAIVPGGQDVRYDVRMVEGELRVQAVCIKDIDMGDSEGRNDLDQRQGKLDMILMDGDHPFYKSQEMQLEVRITDGDPRARIDIAGVQHLVSRDNDTIQTQ